MLRNYQIKINSLVRKVRVWSGKVNLLAAFEKVEKFMFGKKLLSKKFYLIYRRVWLCLPNYEMQC